jgi:hypothetical protein
VLGHIKKIVIVDAKRVASAAIHAWLGIFRGNVDAFGDEVLIKIFSV